MVAAFADLREAGVSILTVGQYLRPTERHLPVVRYWEPEEFTALEAAAYELGFEHIAAGPLVRSSYHADEHVSRTGRASARWPPRRRAARRVPFSDRDPAAGQHPDRRTARRDDRADRRERPRLLLLAARRASRWATRARRTTSASLQDYGAIPYELTHPGDQVLIARAARTPTRVDLD